MDLGLNRVAAIVVSAILICSCNVDFDKGAIFNKDGYFEYFFEDALYYVTWKHSPKRFHKIRHCIESYADGLHLGDTVSINLQDYFDKRIDKVYYIEGWWPAWAIAEDLHIEYNAICIKEHTRRIILVSDGNVTYHEDIPPGTGINLDWKEANPGDRFGFDNPDNFFSTQIDIFIRPSENDSGYNTVIALFYPHKE